MKVPTILFLFIFFAFYGYAQPKGYSISHQIISDTSYYSTIPVDGYNVLQNNRIYSTTSPKVHWIKIEALDSFKDSTFLLLSNSINNFIDVFLKFESGQIHQYTLGVDQNYESSTYLPSTHLSKDVETIYISLRSNSFLTEQFTIVDQKTLNRCNYNYLLLYFGMFSILIAICIYLFIVYWNTKKKVIKRYSYFVLVTAGSVLFISNFGRLFIWDNLPFSNSYFENIFSCLMIITYLLFSKDVTDVKLWSRKIEWAANAIILILPILLIATFFLQNLYLASKVSNIAPLIAIFVISLMVFGSFIRKNQNSGLFLVGFVFFLSGVSIRLFINFGLINNSFYLEFLLFLLVLSEIFIFMYVVLLHIQKRLFENEEEQLKLVDSLEKIDSLKVKIDQLENQTKNTAFTTVDSSINSALIAPLSKREIEVLNQLAKGLSYQQIAKDLFISINTLKSHVSKIYAKLETNNKVEAINKVTKISALQKKQSD